MKQLLSGKTAIINGASSGIGETTAELLASEGANVVLTARREEKLREIVTRITDKGGKAIYVVADSTLPESPSHVFQEAISAFGQVDILVNNAGFGDMSSIEETTDEHFEKVIQINYFSVFRFCREAIQHFMPRNEGVIVNVSSINGSLPVCGVAYTSTKGAVNILTKNVALRFTGTRIRCNAVAPGVTDTPMAAEWAAGKLPGGDTMLKYSNTYSNTELPPTAPIDQANTILFLASDMSRAITGQVIVVDNGAYMGA
ncbi:SDR family oxidoreductase [Pseudomonas sp. RIT-To-2]|uniref:SDR family oxidoreductase n=1 Tax=Pseudomonas sp. RIT-To-2 TaxID=3462541 RepID=UPI002413725E